MGKASRAGSTSSRRKVRTISESCPISAEKVVEIFAAYGGYSAKINQQRFATLAQLLSWHPGSNSPDPLGGPEWPQSVRATSAFVQAVIQINGLIKNIEERATTLGLLVQDMATDLGRLAVAREAIKALNANYHCLIAPLADEPRPQRLRLVTLMHADAALQEGGIPDAARLKYPITTALLNASAEPDLDEDTLRKKTQRFQKSLATENFPFRRRRGKA